MKSNALTPTQRLASALSDNVTEERLATAISEALVATQKHRDGTIEPDHKVRLEAAKLGLAYSHGRPVERQEVISVNLDADSSLGLAERLANSPTLRKSLQELLDRTEADCPCVENL